MENLLKAIQAVSMEVMNLEKDMQVGEGRFSYKAVSDNQVILAVKRSEEKNGIISIPTKQELVKTEIVKSQNKDGRDVLSYVDVIMMTTRIHLISDPTKFIEVESFGRGLDSGDKGLGKASTYARKYALLNAYKIATGEDPDKDKSPEQKVDHVDEEKNAVTDYMMRNTDYTLSVIKHFGAQSMDDLTIENIRYIYSDLKKKGRI